MYPICLNSYTVPMYGMIRIYLIRLHVDLNAFINNIAGYIFSFTVSLTCEHIYRISFSVKVNLYLKSWKAYCWA